MQHMRSGQVISATASIARNTSERSLINTRLAKITTLLPQVLDYTLQIFDSTANVDVVILEPLVLDLKDFKALRGLLDSLLLAGTEGTLSGTVLSATPGDALFGVGRRTRIVAFVRGVWRG